MLFCIAVMVSSLSLPVTVSYYDNQSDSDNLTTSTLVATPEQLIAYGEFLNESSANSSENRPFKYCDFNCRRHRRNGGSSDDPTVWAVVIFVIFSIAICVMVYFCCCREPTPAPRYAYTQDTVMMPPPGQGPPQWGPHPVYPMGTPTGPVYHQGPVHGPVGYSMGQRPGQPPNTSQSHNLAVGQPNQNPANCPYPTAEPPKQPAATCPYPVEEPNQIQMPIPS